jgi:hypothetical protein
MPMSKKSLSPKTEAEGGKEFRSVPMGWVPHDLNSRTTLQTIVPMDIVPRDNAHRDSGERGDALGPLGVLRASGYGWQHFHQNLESGDRAAYGGLLYPYRP